MKNIEEAIKLLGEIYTEIENRIEFNGGNLNEAQKKQLYDLELLDEDDKNIIDDGFYDQIAIRFALKVLYILQNNQKQLSSVCACGGHSFWVKDTPMPERLRILSEKSIYCPYCGKLNGVHSTSNREAKPE